MSPHPIEIVLDGNDYVVAMKMLIWAAYPDRPHMRKRERNQSHLRVRGMLDLSRKLALEVNTEFLHGNCGTLKVPPPLPRDHAGRLIVAERIEQRIDRIDLNFRRAFELGFRLQGAAHPAKIVDGYVVPDFTRTILAEGLSYMGVSEAATNTSLKRQYRDRLRTLVEPAAPACHLAAAIGIEGEADFERREMLADLIIRAPQWVGAAFETARFLMSNSQKLIPKYQVFSFSR